MSGETPEENFDDDGDVLKERLSDLEKQVKSLRRQNLTLFIMLASVYVITIILWLK